MTRLTYLAGTTLREGDQEYREGDDISHFAPLMPNLVAAISVGQVRLVDEEGTELPYRFEVRTHPGVFGLLMLDVADAQDSGAASPQATPAPEPEPAADAEDEPDEEFDPAEHTIAEVLDFLDDNPDALADVMVAEAQGKNRVTLMKTLNEMATD